MAPRLGVVLVVWGLLTSGEAARGDDAAPIKARLVKARDDYETEKEAIRKSVLEQFDKKEAEAREKGDKKLLDYIKAERQVYEERGETPKWLPLTIHRRIIVTRETMLTAFQSAIKEFLKLKKDDEAALVEKELKLFQEAGQPPPVRPLEKPVPTSDLLQVGTRWAGTRTATATIPWSLRVQRREGNRFAGEITVEGTRNYAVEGMVDRGRITFATERKGNFHQVYDGQIKEEEITLTIGGVDIKGNPIRGTAKLTLKK